MSFAYVTRVDLSMIKRLLKEQLVECVIFFFVFLPHFAVDPVAFSRKAERHKPAEGRLEWHEEGVRITSISKSSLRTLF